MQHGGCAIILPVYSTDTHVTFRLLSFAVVANALPLAAYNHGLFSAALKASIDGNCTNWVTRSSACNALLDTMSSQIGPLNAYNIEVTCLDGAARTRALHTGAVDAFGPMDGLNPCTAADDALTAYLNRANVQAALHVTAGAKALGAWSECASGRDLAYTRIPQDETKTVYPGLLKKIAVLIFNGACNCNG